MHRFFIDPDQLTGATILLTGPEAHHLRSVLRLGPGERIALFDGTGKTYQGEVRRHLREGVEIEILETRSAPPPMVRVRLGQALLKGKKMDLVIQKANELGIDTLAPFVSAHCEVRLPDAEKEERWRRIIQESCKQCGRPHPMPCLPTVELSAILAEAGQFDLKLIFWEGERERTLRQALAESPTGGCSALALTGPEGGFSRQEVASAQEAGFQPVSLGGRILRAETASLAATAILQYSLGNLE